MAQAKYIPSPAEIAEIVRRRSQGLDDLSVAQMQRHVTQTEKVAGRVAALEVELKKKKRTGKDIQEALMILREKYDFSAMEQLMLLVCEKDADGQYTLDKKMGGDPNTRIGILKTLVEYEAPKLKSVEVSGTVEHEHKISIIRYGDDGAVTEEPITRPVIPVEASVERLEEGSSNG